MTFVAAAIGGALGYGVAGTLTGAAIGAGLGSQVGSSMNQASAAKNAAQLQYQATQDAARQQREMFDIINQQQAPYREAGYSSLNKIQEMLPYFTKMPTAADLRSMPGFEFGLNQGAGGVGQQMNVSSPGSNVDMARTKFATDYATNVGLPQYMNQQSNIYNRLASLAGIGQTGQTQANQVGMNTTNALSQLGIGGASALGAGQVGAANAQAAGMQNIGNAGMMYSFLNPSSGGSYTPAQIASANAMNVPTSAPALGPEFNQYLVP